MNDTKIPAKFEMGLTRTSDAWIGTFVTSVTHLLRDLLSDGAPVTAFIVTEDGDETEIVVTDVSATGLTFTATGTTYAAEDFTAVWV